MKLVELIAQLTELNREVGNVPVLDGIGQSLRSVWSYRNPQGDLFAVVDTETPD